MRFGAWLLKAAAAGIAALVVLNAFCLAYYNSPPTLASDNGITSDIKTPGRFYAYGVEGYGYGKVDAHGYINPPEAAGHAAPDMLIMGSSNMEALQLPQRKHAASVLRALLPDKRVYSVGRSGYDFLTNTQNLRGAIAAKRPRYVAMEAFGVTFSDARLRQALDEQLPDVAHPYTEGPMYYIQQVPFLKLLFFQYSQSLMPFLERFQALFQPAIASASPGK